MIQNVAASVRQRLLNLARAEGRPYNEVLQYYCLERFLYRLGRSPYRDRFVLKGALMLAAWRSPITRTTRDIDLLGRLDNTPAPIEAAIRAICREPATEDGLRFDPESVAGERIIEAAQYAGVRVSLTAYLGKARIPMQIDVGFGDPVVPGASSVSLPSLLDFPPPEVQGYSRESAIAEKFQVMVYLGEINSRMKDFYDVWLLATQFPFAGLLLSQAVRETFAWRETAIPRDPVAFSDAFCTDTARQAQWTAFVARHRLQAAPDTLCEAVRLIAAFLSPVAEALREEREFDRRWPPGGPWPE